MFKPGKLKKFAVLIILDGWGVAGDNCNNLINITPTPNLDKLIETYPSAVLNNPLDADVLQDFGEDACRLSHYMIGTSQIENDIKIVESQDPLQINSLSRVLSQHNLKQLYLADIEKFPQVSHFYRGCYTKLLEGEEQVLVPGKVLKDDEIVSEDCLKNLFDELKKQLETRKFNFITINLSSVDVVAHSGDGKITAKAIKMVDKYLGKIVEKILGWGGELVIVSDHGNAEELIDGKLKQVHTTNCVPFVFVSKDFEGKSYPGVNLVGAQLSCLQPVGSLVDIAPTILKALSIKKPKEMVGKSLL